MPGAAAPMAIPKSVTETPSGSWSFGVLTVTWSINNDDSIDVKLSVAGFDVADVTGTLTSTNTSIDDKVSLLGVITGDLTLTAKYNDGTDNGLWISGQITAGSWSSGQLNHCILPW
jgi:hypothetical protein